MPRAATAFTSSCSGQTDYRQEDQAGDQEMEEVGGDMFEDGPHEGV